MKSKALALPALLLLSVLPLGCKSTEGHDHADTTADKVVAVGHAAGQTQLHLDQTLEYLSQVEATAKQDPKPAYKSFASSCGSFGSEVARLTSERAALKTSAEAWFTEFAKQNGAIADEDLRRTGEKRLAEFKEKVGETSEQVDELVKDTTAVETRLKDLHTYLSNDLTPDGIEAVSGRIGDVTKDGRKLAVRLGELSKASDALATKMRAARKPAETAPAK